MYIIRHDILCVHFIRVTAPVLGEFRHVMVSSSSLAHSLPRRLSSRPPATRNPHSSSIISHSSCLFLPCSRILANSDTWTLGYHIQPASHVSVSVYPLSSPPTPLHHHRSSISRFEAHVGFYYLTCLDRKSTRLNSSHQHRSRMPSSA